MLRAPPATSFHRDECHGGGSAPTPLRHTLVCLAILAVSGASPVASQGPWPVSLEFTAGAGFGGSSARHSTSGRGLAIDALVGFRPGARAVGGFVVAMSTSGQAFGVYSACDVVPGGTCPPNFPSFWTLSTLAGWETRNGRARFLIGPAVARSSVTLVGAAQARLDVATPITGQISLLTSGRFVHIPNYRGDSFSLGSIGVGLRLR